MSPRIRSLRTMALLLCGAAVLQVRLGSSSSASPDGNNRFPPALPQSAALAAPDGRASDYAITIATNASSEEWYAADRLQHWLQAACGCTISIARPTSSGRKQIAVGSDAAATFGVSSQQTADLGLEGFILASDATRVSVAITGAPGAPRGVIYGVYEYLERLGFGFWASDATTVPADLSHLYISGLKERQTPALPDWRHNNNANLELQENAAFSIAARQNNNGGTEVYTSRDVQKVGGGVRWASPPGFVHTSFTIVPPGELREKHPEWFGETQLCWTNRSLIAFIIGRVKGYLEADPNATVISVTQNDGGSACHNTEEDRVAKEEGSDAGPLLRAVNSIADAIKDEHPSVVVETLAYTYTRKAPKLTRPRPNVVIRLSNIECDFFHPLSANTSAGANPAFVADLKAWHVISNRTWIWTYVTDFSNWMMPWPDYFTMEANIQFYVEHGVTGVYQEGQYMAYGGDLQALKSWLGMKLMWNPYRNTSDLISQFAYGYYGSVAAPFVLRHIEIFVDSAANSSSMFLSEGVSYTSSYLSPAACIDALTNIKEAEVKVSAAAGLTNDSTTLARLKAIKYGTLYVVLLRWDEMKGWAAANNRTWPGDNASKQEMLTQFTSYYRHTHMDVRIGFDPTVPLDCNRSASATCFVLDQKVQPPSCGLACAMIPCLESGICDLDCGLSEGCHGIDWFTNAVLTGLPPPPSVPTGPPGTRSFPDCHGYDCGPGSKSASPATAYGDRCFAPGGGSSQLGPFVCCNASVPASMHAKMPCTLSQNVHGCWWPISVGCPGVPPGSVCPLRLPYQYGSDEAGWYCCATDVGPRVGACADSCCLTAGSSSGCQRRAKCYNETVGAPDV